MVGLNTGSLLLPALSFNINVKMQVSFTAGLQVKDFGRLGILVEL
jgi:hypothetical protein